MVEYSIVTWVLVVALVLACTVHIIPGGTNGDGTIQKQKRNVIEMFLQAYQSYYDSFYFVLNLPFP